MFESEPLMNIEWRDSRTLNANDYNPNVVFNQELRLLERSIMLTGWVQPILITKDGTIIDGFHRSRLSQESKQLINKYNYLCPCAVLDVPREQAMVLTIRMNRAKGSHVALRMSHIVHELIDDLKMPPEQVAQEIGATKAEVDLLYQDNVFTMKGIKDYKYSKAWYPAESRNRKRD